MLLIQRFRCVATSHFTQYCLQQYLSRDHRLAGLLHVKQRYSTDHLWKRFQGRDMGRRGNTTKNALDKLDKEKKKSPASKIVLSVVGNGKAGSPRSLLISTTYASYIFNVGEGSTRAIEENKLRISKLEHIFFTHNSWASVGGVVGLAINLYQGKEDGKLRVHGPPNTEKIIAASRNFCDLENLVIGKAEVSEGGFEDTTFRFEYVPLIPEKEDSTDEPAPKKPKLNGSKEGDENGDMSVVFICKPKPLRRNINLKKCLDRGLPSGKYEYVKQLLLEKDVTLEDGTVVRADDVLDTYRGDLGTVVVAEVPSRAYLGALAASERLHGLGRGTGAGFGGIGVEGGGGDEVHCVVHFSPQHVIDTPIYQNWMSSFDPSVKHFLLNDHENGGNLSLVTPLENQVLMSQLNSEVFPLLHLQQQYQEDREQASAETSTETTATSMEIRVETNAETSTETNAETSTENSAETVTEASTETSTGTKETEKSAEGKLNLIYGKTNMSYVYREGRNNQILSSEQCPSYSYQNAYEQIAEQYLTSEKMLALKSYQQTLMEKAVGGDKGKYPEVVFLGTGSSKPSAMRNASSILVRLSASSCMLLDCGEGTYGQMLRFYGPEETRQILQDLKAVYISHLHADHHMGTLAVLTARQAVMAELDDGESNDSESVAAGLPYLFAPLPYQRWLSLINDKVLPVQQLYRFVNLESLQANNKNNLRQSTPLSQEACQFIGLKQFMPVRVIHRQHPFGIVLTSAAGYKMVYSGDTRPCADLARAGRDCDLLIHEATLADDVEAHSKFHSSFSQALDIAEQMRAKFTVLTHLSQRYANLSDDASKEFPLDRRNYAIAFDNMRVNPSLLPVAASLVPVVKHLFAGLRRSDYPPVIDDEITELLAGTQRNTPPRTQRRSRTPERERRTPERSTQGNMKEKLSVESR